MPPLFTTPDLDLTDQLVLDEIEGFRMRLGQHLRAPRSWTGGLRRSAQAKAIRGSNSIEGYLVDPQDALAAVDGEEPMTADERTWAEIVGYRRVLTYVLRMGSDPGFRLDGHTLRSMHFMLLEHDLAKSPGQFRTGEIFIEREDTHERVYTGPGAVLVPDLIDDLAHELTGPRDHDHLVRAAMAHLNLVMIHPFRDGNGRMARALQTLVLAREHPVEPIFDSIEEWLGANTEDYYRILALTGGGAWKPDRDAHLWVKFCLRAHHMQAQTVAHRFDEAQIVGNALLDLIRRHGFPDRVFDPLFDTSMGLSVRRPGYVRRSQIEERTASRDFKALVDVGLLEARGNTRGRFYIAAGPIAELAAASRRRRQRLTDPYPELLDTIARELRGLPNTNPDNA